MKIERVAASKGCMMITNTLPEFQHAAAEAARLTAERDTARTERDHWRRQAEQKATFLATLAETAFPRLYGQFWSHGVVDQPTKEVTRLRNARITDCGF